MTRTMSDVADEAIAVAWRRARRETNEAYHRWSMSTADRRRIAYAVFVAAADREERAEQAYLAALRRSAQARLEGFPAWPTRS